MIQDPTLKEMRELLTDTENFYREEAIYWYAANHHSGQNSNLYEALSQSEYKPGPLCNGPIDNTLYNELVTQFGGELIADD